MDIFITILVTFLQEWVQVSEQVCRNECGGCNKSDAHNFS